MIRTTVGVLTLLAFVAAMFPPVAHAAEANPDWVQLAERQGPILWHYPEEIRRDMENDLEMLRLYNEAMAGQKRRKAIGLAFFIPGAICVGGGFFIGLFQNAIGGKDDEHWLNRDLGDAIFVGGIGIGLGLVATGVYFTAFDSQAEKTYKSYIEEKYGVKPIIQISPTPGGAMASLGLKF